MTVGDADNDPLTITWTPSRGTIVPLNAPKTLVQWNVPNAVGEDSITITVSDGTESRTIVEPIKVGYPHTGTTAPSVFLKSRSPYIVALTSGVVLAITNSTTIIEPGTELLLDTPNMVIDVGDTLLAVGTSAEPIVIRPNIRSLSCGDDRGWWEGIKVSTPDPPDDGYLQMEHATVSYAQYTVRLRDGGSAYIRASHIRCSGQNGILHEGAGILVVEDSEIRDGAFDGIAVNSGFHPDSIRVDGCYIGYNGRTGISLNLQDQQKEIPIIVEYTNIEINRDHGITLDGAVFPQIHYNRFFGNGAGTQHGLSNIWLFNGFPGGATVPTLNAACNYFGAISNVSQIEVTIRDSQDTGTIGTDVVVSPWSNENPITTPSLCIGP